MQLIVETYEVMRKGLGLSGGQMHEIFTKWNEGRLQSFLIEITRDIFAYKEPGSKTLLLDIIKDEAKSKGTGKWTSQVAMDLQMPITAIDTAVSMRDLSKYKAIRESIFALPRRQADTRRRSTTTDSGVGRCPLLQHSNRVCAGNAYAFTGIKRVCL